MSQTTGSTALLILTQVASRALTFIGNQIILRFSAPTLLGIAVQLELVSVTVLYFARESLRVALQRQPQPASSTPSASKSKVAASRQLQGAINTSYLAVVFGVLIGAASFTYYLSIAPSEVTSSPQFKTAINYYTLATLAELLSEPFFAVIQQQGLFRVRAATETRAAINRCLFACAVAFYTYRQGDEQSILPFATGQLAYGVTLLVLYFRAAREASAATRFSLQPRRLPTDSSSASPLSYFPRSLISLALTFYAQSIFKLLLTQGDALLLSFLAPLHSQGAFALASNYGGLLARLLFQPIEESSRNTFGALLGTTTFPSNTRAALTHLALTLHTYTLGALLLLTLLPPLLPTLTPLALSAQWRTAETTALLSSYVYYIPLTAVNGVLDAFVTSVATARQLHAQSLSMALFTALYAAAAWLFLERLKYGAQGLVWANAVGMLARVAWGAWFVGRWIREREPRELQREGSTVGAEKTAASSTMAGGGGASEADVQKPADSNTTTKPAEPMTPRWFWTRALPDPVSVVAGVAVAACLRLTLPSSIAAGQGEARAGGGLNAQHVSFVAMAAIVLGASVGLREMQFLSELVSVVVPVRIRERVAALWEGWVRGDEQEEGREGEEGEEEDEEGQNEKQSKKEL